MEVHALYGESGTGKSTSALAYAYEEHIPAIVDDGLLIFNRQRIAGISAKGEKNYITAVKRAIFYYQEHAEDVREAIERLQIKKILLIGTSTKMVKRIAKKLQIGDIDLFIHISEIRTSNEIKAALFSRRTRGRHIIPVPQVQIEQNIFQKLITQGIRIISPKKGLRDLIVETTIVQPRFHNYTLHISEQVYETIAKYAISPFSDILTCNKVKINLEGLPSLDVELTLKWTQDCRVRDTLEKVQKKISEDFIQYLDLELFSIDLHVIK